MARKENARQRILEEAEALVAERGVDALNMDVVAMMAGLGKGGVLYHFRYKVDLLQALLERHVERWDNMLAMELDDSDDVYAWLDNFITFNFQKKGQLYRSGVAIFTAASRYPELMQPVLKFYQERQQKIACQVSDPRLAEILVLAADGFSFFSALSLPPISESEVDAVRERMLGMVEAMRQAEDVRAAT